MFSQYKTCVGGIIATGGGIAPGGAAVGTDLPLVGKAVTPGLDGEPNCITHPTFEVLRLLHDAQVCTLGQAGKLPPMLPGVVFQLAVGKDISDGVGCDSISVVLRQQVAPGTVISIADGILHRTQSPGGIGVFFFAQNVACVIIGPDPGLARCLVILPGQLVGGVIDSLIVEGMRP